MRLVVAAGILDTTAFATIANGKSTIYFEMFLQIYFQWPKKIISVCGKNEVKEQLFIENKTGDNKYNKKNSYKVPKKELLPTHRGFPGGLPSKY